MNAVQRDQAIGRRLARNGLRLTRSDHAPYAWERIADYRARAATISSDAFCTVAGVQPVRAPELSQGRAS